jgi:hypothetical protein
MVGTAVGYLLGGVVGETWGIQKPFEIAALLFVVSSIFAAVFIPYIDPVSISKEAPSRNGGIWHRTLGGLKVLTPKTTISSTGIRRKEFGITFLALGVFLGVLATGYAPILIQMYSTAVLGFVSSENGYLMAGNSLMRGMYLIFLFPKIIHMGRRWFSASVTSPSACIETAPDPNAAIPAQQENEISHDLNGNTEGHEFDLLFLRWSLVMDGLITSSTAFATQKWHIYLGLSTFCFKSPLQQLTFFRSGSPPPTRLRFCTGQQRRYHRDVRFPRAHKRAASNDSGGKYSYGLYPGVIWVCFLDVLGSGKSVDDFLL